MEMGDDIWKNIQKGYYGNDKVNCTEIVGNMTYQIIEIMLPHISVTSV